MTSAIGVSVFDMIAEDAAAESQLWAEALRPVEARAAAAAVFSALVSDPGLAAAVETIYEGYLVHYGRPRLFAPQDADAALLLGDYLYAHGLVRVATTGNVEAVRDLAELISICAQGRGNGRDGDGEAWAATAALLGEGSLDAAREALRDAGSATLLSSAARAAAGVDAVELALAAHRRLAP
jgi:hypothetical protein